VILLVLVAIGAAGAGAGSPAGAAPSSTLSINERDSGKTFTLRRTTSAALRLSGKWVWNQPKVRGRAVVLSPVDYRSDPGFKEWEITRRAAGTVKITAYGRPNCGGCSRRARFFRVTLKVR
jgi:hypothetical protein